VKRRLSDVRVGEYKINIGCVFCYNVLIVAAILGIFLFPIAIDSGIKLSPVNYLIEGKYASYIGNCSIAYISLCVILFINSFLILSVSKIGRSVFSKISKLFELLCSLCCLILHGLYFFVSESSMMLEAKYYFSWMLFLVMIMLFSLINYYETKKISIYD
jgi:hypothetical protein